MILFEFYSVKIRVGDITILIASRIATIDGIRSQILPPSITSALPLLPRLIPDSLSNLNMTNVIYYAYTMRSSSHVHYVF